MNLDATFPEYVPAAKRRAERSADDASQEQERISDSLARNKEAHDRLLRVREELIEAGSPGLRPVEVIGDKGMHLEAAWVLRKIDRYTSYSNGGWREHQNTHYMTYVLFKDGRVAFLPLDAKWEYEDAIEVPQLLIAQQAQLLTNRESDQQAMNLYLVAADRLEGYLKTKYLSTENKNLGVD